MTKPTVLSSGPMLEGESWVEPGSKGGVTESLPRGQPKGLPQCLLGPRVREMGEPKVEQV